MSDYESFVRERTGGLGCFHLFHGETCFEVADFGYLEEQSFEDKLLRLDSYQKLSEKALIAIKALFYHEDAVKFYSFFDKKFRNYAAMEKLMEHWKRDRPHSLRKGLRIYLRRHEGFSISEVNRTFVELKEFVSTL